MQLTYFLTAAFAASATAAKFNNFADTECQKYGGEYVKVTAGELQKIAQETYASSPTIGEASRFLSTADDKRKCPSNSDDTYKWLAVPQWRVGNPFSGGAGGSIAVVYYKESDTYALCRVLANVQSNNYAGFCRQ